MSAHTYSCVALVSFLAATAVPAHARAQTADDLARAESLFNEGRALSAQGKYDAACAKFEESLATVDGTGTRFNLADCEEHRRHYLKAHTLFLEVAEQAKDAGQAEREAVARERAAALDSKLSRLTVELQVPSVEFELDGKPVTNQALSGPVVVEPGKHRVSARRPGAEPWSSEINVPRGGLFVIVKVPRLEQAAPADPAPVHRRPAPLAQDTPQRSAEGARTAQRVALVLGGVGLGAVLAGATFGIQYLSSNDDAKKICPTSENCTADEIAEHQRFLNDTKTKRTWSYVGLGVGGAALAGAGIIYLTLGRHTSVAASTGLNADGAWNLALRGKF